MVDVPFGQSATIKWRFLDAAGNVAQVDGLPTVSSTLGDVSAVTVDGDVFSVVVTLAGVGSASVSVTADVDRGEGVKPLALPLADLNFLPSPEASAVVVDSVTVG